jgi:Protein of unknown function (DUF2752)
MTRHAKSVFWICSAAALAGSVSVGAILFCFDPSSYSFYPICLFHRFTGLLCPGCGSLRAMHQLLHGNISAGFHFNPLLVIALPMFAWFAVVSAIRILKNEPVRLGFPAKWMWLFLGIGLAFSIWRNLPGSPFATLPR